MHRYKISIAVMILICVNLGMLAGNSSYNPKDTLPITNHYDEISLPSIPLDAADEEIQNRSIFNQVVFVAAGYNSTVFPIPMQKNSVYSFYFQTETPYSSAYSIEVWVISPSGKSYRCHVHASKLQLNKSYDYFEFGAAESGQHQLNVIIATTENMNVHFAFRFLDTLENYYKFKSRDLKLKQTYAYTFFTDISCFNSNNREKIYEFNLLENVEYVVNFFRVVPVFDSPESGFQEPYIWGKLWQAGTDEFMIYPYSGDYKVQSSGYALSTNKAFEYSTAAAGMDFSSFSLESVDWGFLNPNNVNFLENEVTLSDICPLDDNILSFYEDNADNFIHPLNNPKVNVHFGTSKAGTSTFHLSLDLPENNFDRDVNYVFLIHGVTSIGDGPANNTEPPPPKNETRWYDWWQESENSTFSEVWANINAFIVQNTDILLIALVPAFAIGFGVDYYRKLKKPKLVADQNRIIEGDEA
jgi:hypothetical protein